MDPVPASSIAEPVALQDNAQSQRLDGPDELPLPIIKLKGRKRLLQTLQRMSSSPSISRLARPASASYRGNGQGSMSCISLSSASYSYGVGTPLELPPSAGYATAASSYPSTPRPDTPNLSRIRFADTTKMSRPSTATSVSLPFDMKYAAIPVTAPGRVVGREDYFSTPLALSESKAPLKMLDFWGDMPAEIRMQILRMLAPKEIVRCAVVSRSWHKMCFDGQLWAKLDTADFYSEIPAKALVKIVTQAGPFVRDLNLRGCVQLRDSWRPKGLAEACGNLEHLSLEGCAIPNTAIESFLRHNPRLLNLNLSGLSITNSTMRLIAETCSRLEVLNVSWCKQIDGRGLSKVLGSCPELKDLRASEVEGFDNLSLMDQMFQSNKLERLILVNCESLTDGAFKALFEGVDTETDILTGHAIVPPRVLRHLDISRCRNITDHGLQALVHNVPLLEGLQLAKCRSLTDASLMPLLPTLPHLTHLDLEELELLTNATLQELATSACCSVLQHLSISYCELLGDSGMLPVVKACPNLRNLDLDNTRISDLVLAEAASMVRQRCSGISLSSYPNPHVTSLRPRAITWDGGSSPKTSTISTGPAVPKVGLRMVVFDCQNVTWTGIREVMSRNAEIRRPTASSFFHPSFARATTATTHAQAHAGSPHAEMRAGDEPLNTTTTSTTTMIQLSQKPQARIATAPSHPNEVISLKVFYGYQPTVTEHTRRVLRGDLSSASRLERKWAEYMVASEEAGAAMGVGTGNGLGRFGGANANAVGFGTMGNRRRRRRVREAQMMHADEEEGGVGMAGVGRRRRARSNGGCAMM